MGDADIRRAAETSNRLLQTPVRAIREGGLASGSKVGNTLLELRRTVEDLDPSQATGVRKFLGVIPFGDKVVDYFRRYESAQGHLNGILHSLRNGQDELTKDNVALNMEKQNLWATMGPAELLHLRRRAPRREARRPDQPARADRPERAKALSQDVLFYVRQKHQDLLTQLAVSIQSYLADRHHHQEQHRADQGRGPGIDHHHRGPAHRGHRRPGAGQPEAGPGPDHRAEHHDLDLIQRTSEMLRDNSAAIQQQAASATIGLPSCRPRSPTSTPPWTQSTRSR
jgi:uncharacterized protein YaaN involved in tellurite resistance